MDDALVSLATLNMSSSFRRLLHWVGSGLALMGIVFVVVRLYVYWLEIDVARITPSACGSIMVFSILYGLANVALALAWRRLLEYLGASATPLASIRIYGLSQLAKYVPGNIFHLAGRQALGMAAGISAGILVKSTLWELGLMAAAGALFGWMLLPPWLPGFPSFAGPVLVSMSAALMAGLLYPLVGLKPIRAFFWYIVFMLASGLIFIGLLESISGAEGVSIRHGLTIGSAYIVAWLVGLVTPGAPAGVGVREMILLLLLNGIVAENELLVTVLLGRLVTVAGDLLFFVMALMLFKSGAIEKAHV